MGSEVSYNTRHLYLSFLGCCPLDTLDGQHSTDINNLAGFRIGNPFKGESLIKTNKSEKADLEAAKIAAEKTKADNAAALLAQQVQAQADSSLAAAATEKAKADNKTTTVIVISILVAVLAGAGIWFYVKKGG